MVMIGISITKRSAKIIMKNSADDHKEGDDNI
jgi:hypothetical protein